MSEDARGGADSAARVGVEDHGGRIGAFVSTDIADFECKDAVPRDWAPARAA